ncbi:hypothetical protein ACFE04_001677 [Oxalis oulophora]
MSTLKEKPKRGFMSITNFYKSNIRKSHHKPKPNEQPVLPPPVTTLDSSNTPMTPNLLLMQKFETFQEMDRRFNGGSDGGRRGAVMVDGGRKSVSHVETNLRSVAGFLQVKVLVCDMPGFMQAHAFRCARTSYDCLEKFSSKHVAYNIKKSNSKGLKLIDAYANVVSKRWVQLVKGLGAKNNVKDN